MDVLRIRHLDLQAEYNSARPFTYSHASLFTNYAHYRQPLAHPLGSNFKEFVFIGRYQPLKKAFIVFKYVRQLRHRSCRKKSWR